MRPTLVVAGAAALALSGCGSSTLSNSALRSQATRICLIAQRQANQIATPSSPAGTGRFLGRGVAVLGPELRGLRALRPPNDVADVYSTSLSAFAKKLGYMRSTLHNLRQGADPMIAIKTLQQQLVPVESQENSAWQALQIPACVNQ